MKSEIPVNAYGNVDVRQGVPAGFVHINAKRLTVTCAAIGVECAPALTGWKSGKWGGPEISGVVVHAEDEAKVREAMQRRAARRLTYAQKEERCEAQHQKDADNFAESIRTDWPGMPEEDVLRCAWHATEIGSGRVGRSSTAEDPVRAAVVAYARHNYTNYDQNFDYGEDRESNRDAIRAELAKVLSKWEGLREVNNNPVSEYWIDHRGQVELAEDSANHASIVIEELAREILEHSGISIDEPGCLEQCEAEIKQRIYADLDDDEDLETFDSAWNKDPAQTFYNWLKARGVHKKYPEPNQFDDAFFTAWGCSGSDRDPRDYGLKYWNWARVSGDDVQVYKINTDVLRNIVLGLNDILEQEGDWYGDAEEPKFNIEVMKTKKFYQNVPFSVLESGDLGALRVY